MRGPDRAPPRHGMTQEPTIPAASELPPAGSSREQLEFCLGYALLAPSGHNTQPWLFRIEGDAALLYADRRRALPVVDPDDRELVMSCGAALFTLRVALRRFGFEPLVTLFPDPENRDFLASVRLHEGEAPTAAELELFDAIPRRRTNRARYDARPLPEVLVAGLVREARAEGAWLEPVGEEARAAVADLVAEGDRTQAADPRFRRELAAWVRPNHGRSRDGMPGYAFGMGDVLSAAAPLVLRAFDWGKRQAAKDSELAENSPLLAVVGSGRDEPRAWLEAGQALQRVLLHSCVEGATASFLNQPIEVPELRPRLAAILGIEGHPQLLLRLGYGPEARPTPRRPLREVLLGGEDQVSRQPRPRPRKT